MYNYLVSYFDNYNTLNQNQFGFLQGHSSHHALNTLVNKITKSLDTGDMVNEIYLDLKSFWNSNSSIITLQRSLVLSAFSILLYV